jgi:hypothetical protein
MFRTDNKFENNIVLTNFDNALYYHQINECIDK